MDKTLQRSDHICRLCLSEDKKHLISASTLINSSISIQDIERFTGIQIKQNECVACAICINCREKLEHFVAFRRLCIDNDTLFRKLFGFFVETASKHNRCSDTLSTKGKKNLTDETEEPDMKPNSTLLHSNIEIAVLNTLSHEESILPRLDYTLCETSMNDYLPGEVYNQTSCSSSGLYRNEMPNRFIKELDERVDYTNDSEKDIQHPNEAETSQLATNLSCPSKAGRRNTKAKFSCSYCSIQMTLKSNLQHHIKNLHLKNTSKTCALCGKTFASYYAYQHHKVSQHANREYETQCNVCSKKFTSLSSYNLHYARNHGSVDEKNRPKTKKKQLCGVCGLMVTQLATHSLTHNQEKRLACPHCPVKMTDKGNLARHIQAVHLKKVVRTCETCGKEFLHVNLYKYHMLSVHGIGKSFDYDICLKKFKTLAVLKIHKVSLHSNEKRFECGTCGMMFKVKHTLRTHEKRVHSVEKPFACSQCPKRFKSPYGKKSHELTHSGITFACTFCEKTYRYKSLLQTHMRKQHSKMEETN